MNTLKDTILNYSGIINEDKPEAYAADFYAKVVSKIMNQSNLTNVSFVSYNKERIEKSKRTKDHKMYDCNSSAEFAQKVVAWFKATNHLREQDKNFIIKAATDYYNKFISL